MGARPQRRVLVRRRRPPVRPAGRRPGVRVPGGQRRCPAAGPVVACSTRSAGWSASAAGRRRCRAGGSNCWNRPTARWSRSSAGSATSRSWSWPTCRRRPSRSSWTWPPLSGGSRSRCSAGRRFRRSATGRTCSPWVRTASTGSGCRRRPSRSPPGSPRWRPSRSRCCRPSTVAGGWDTVFDGEARGELERDGPARPTCGPSAGSGARPARWPPSAWPTGGRCRSATAFLVVLDVEFAGGHRDLYFLPLAVAEGPAAVRVLQRQRGWVVARLRGPSGEAVLHDALADDAVCTALLDAVAAGREFRTTRRPHPGRIHRRVRPPPRRPELPAAGRPRAGHVEQLARLLRPPAVAQAVPPAGGRDQPGLRGRPLPDRGQPVRPRPASRRHPRVPPAGRRPDVARHPPGPGAEPGRRVEARDRRAGPLLPAGGGPDVRPGPGRPRPAAAARADRRGPAAGRPGNDRQLPARGRHARPADCRDAPGPGRRPRATPPSPRSRSRPPTWTPFVQRFAARRTRPWPRSGQPRPPAGRRRRGGAGSLLELGPAVSKDPLPAGVGVPAGDQDAHPRRLPPRPGAVGRTTTSSSSTSRASRPGRSRSGAAQVLAAARRGRHAPLVPLRRLRRAVRVHASDRPDDFAPARAVGRRCGTSGSAAAFLRGYRAAAGGPPSVPRPRPSSRPCSTPSCWTRRSTSWLRAEQPARLGPHPAAADHR